MAAMADAGSGDPAALLRVQELDLHVDGLARRREELPARQELGAARARRKVLEREHATHECSRAELAREQRRLEDELSTLEERERSERDRLYSGTVTGPRELQALSDELAAFGRRKDDLETRVLALMEESEPFETAVAELDDSLAEADAEIERCEAAIVEAERAIDEESAALSSERETVAATVPEALLARYVSLRRGRGGSVAGRLDGGRHTACSVAVSAVEADRLHRLPAGTVETCEECGGILLVL
jgi:uncharacterized protein